MFKQFISNCFQSLQGEDVNEAKRKFGLIWAAFASKVIRLNSGELQLSWRELSAELAQVFNEWYDASFTTDAFIKSFDHRTIPGSYPEFDEVLKTINEHPECIGIFIVNQPQLVSGTMEVGISETNLLTGELKYFRQSWDSGKAISKTEIKSEEYENICFGA